MARKYSFPITKEFLCEKFDMDTSGWMRMQHKLERHGIEVIYQRNPSRFLILAGRTLVDMHGNDILSFNQLVLAHNQMRNIPNEYPQIMKGNNQASLLAFLSLNLQNSKNLFDISEMFVEIDIIRGDVEIRDIDIRKRFYYKIFYRVLLSVQNM